MLSCAPMSDLTIVRRALLSVSDKTDLVPFARVLSGEFGVELISTGGTAAAIRAAGLPVRPVEDVTGIPEMLDGRVKTLHPRIHGGLLGRRDRAEHLAAMRTHGIEPIDLVVVNLYPFEATVAQADIADAVAIEQIDIGGPAVLRSAAKNHDFVGVVTEPAQYDRVASELRTHGGALTAALRQELAASAFMRTAAYDAAIAAWMARHRERPFPELLRLAYPIHQNLRYGENPHQGAALYSDPAWRGTSVVHARVAAGKALSYNNYLDAATALEVARELALTSPDRVTAVIVKHTNPCGAACAASPAEAFAEAEAADPVAAFGGVFATSGTIDADAADAIAAGGRFLEVIVAARIEPEAESRLAARWKNLRMVETGPLTPANGRSPVLRSIPGGLLVQDRDSAVPDPAHWVHAAGPAPSDADLTTARFAMIVAKHLTSNAIAIADGVSLLGAGCGQVDRVGACRIAVAKAGARLGAASRPAAASDAFFPFPDGPAILIDAGVRVIVHPGGSVRDDETIQLCRERGVTCLLTGERHFRH